MDCISSCTNRAGRTRRPHRRPAWRAPCNAAPHPPRPAPAAAPPVRADASHPGNTALSGHFEATKRTACPPCSFQMKVDTRSFARLL
ncbi:MAG TPA: hypothetical protein DEB31_09880 [Clostridiales bacterium]|nr:hypothetical protein [Clostridiales bacterium]